MNATKCCGRCGVPMSRAAWAAEAGVCARCHYWGWLRKFVFRTADLLVRTGVRVHGAMQLKKPMKN